MDYIIVDVIVGLLLVVTTCAMAYLGVHVTLHPIGPDDHKARDRRKAQFIFCGILIAVVTVAQIIRNGIAQNQLMGSLTDLKKIQPKVEVNVPPTTILRESKPSAAKEDNAKFLPAVAQNATIESLNSLRRRTVQLANELDIWENKMFLDYPNPNGNDDPTLQKRRADFDAEMNQKYLHEFRDRTVEIVKSLENKGLNVWTMAGRMGRGKTYARDTRDRSSPRSCVSPRCQ